MAKANETPSEYLLNQNTGSMKKVKSMALYLVIGIALGSALGSSIGTVIGSVQDNVGLGISMGISIGSSIGFILGAVFYFFTRSPDDKELKDEF